MCVYIDWNPVLSSVFVRKIYTVVLKSRLLNLLETIKHFWLHINEKDIWWIYYLNVF